MLYEEQVKNIINNAKRNGTSPRVQEGYSFVKWVFIILFIVLAGVAVGLYFLFKPKDKSKKETYQDLNYILSQECNLSLPNYIRILNDTSNTQSISLQEICQNWICNLKNLDSQNVSNMIVSVSKPAVVKCLKNKDWLRMALINLKIYNIINMFDNSFNAERALTNGVYGAEYINIPKEDLIKIITYTPKNLNDKMAEDFSMKNAFDKTDKESLLEYTSFILNILKEDQNLKDKVMNCEKIDPSLFSVITAIRIGEIIFFKKSGCSSPTS